MPQSLTKIWSHIIYSTKKHIGFLHDNTLRKKILSCLKTIHLEYESPALIVDGVVDHVHILCTLSKNYTAAKLIGETKRNLSKWAKLQSSMGLTKFQWQPGDAAFSVSKSNMNPVLRVLQDQEEHHRAIIFQEEFCKFLDNYKMEYDKSYV